ncbi:MAG TPA: glycine oxidase ThiO [Vicinamibacterales bacterium]|nr:glycine oxidase ThiO [Vicinamibacterales bacterium]
MAHASVAVVGDGIIGWSAAFELARRGSAVTLFAGGHDGAATPASGGMLVPYTEAHASAGSLDLAVRGLEAWDGFAARVREASGAPFEYRAAGTLEVADTGERATALRARTTAPWAAPARFAWLNAGELAARAPFVRADVMGALLCPVHRLVDVRACLRALQQAALAAGVVAAPGGAVQRVEPAADGVLIRDAAGAARFEHVVLAAGAWTQTLDPFGRLGDRVHPVRGQLLRLHSDAVRSAHILWGSACYIVPWEDGTLLVGATSEDAGFDARATASGVRALLSAAEDLVPGLASATFVEVRVGLRPASGPGVPILGPAREDPRVVYATGHFRNGVLLAPVTAQLVADYILESALDPAFSTP